MLSNESDICPCRINPNAALSSKSINSDKGAFSYSECCQPLHLGSKVADTSEALMRSRYAAFVKVLPDYILKTTLPAQQAYLDKQAIIEWAEQTHWSGLTIVYHNPKVSKRHAQVEFKAYYHDQQFGSPRLSAHHEVSTFVAVKDRKLWSTEQSSQHHWYFLDPTTALNLSQKQPCICGSGEKFKRCCGQFV
ncbi:YchJ family protein [Psychrobacter sp.]|uniref:YchJ family protein n=1 Tax=Psychrobacter sp. TaxID=56811 RepID=UPI0026013DA1|nr:YchJ family protein [Psychrobacter sp.]